MVFKTHAAILSTVLLLGCWGVALGCGSAKPVSKCVPASGTVLVDGQPTAGVVVTLHPVTGGPVVAQAVTGTEGDFVVSTYEQGDGALPGEYLVTCVRGTYNAVSRGFEGDQLGGKYSDPAKSSIRWELTAGQTPASKRIELATK